MFTTQEYIKHFSNDEKRKAFIADHRSWGVWFTQPELGLTYYKHDLPDGARIVVEEYFRAPYSGENNGEDVLMTRLHFQKGKYYSPSASSVWPIAGHLKELKAKLMAELKGQPVNAKE